MKTLYVLNSPSHVESHPSHTCGNEFISDPLCEHFTYLYYNLVNFGLVDEVVIFPRKGQHDLYRDDVVQTIVVKDKKTITVNWDDEKKYEIINNNPGSYVYSCNQYEDCSKLNNVFVIVYPFSLATNSNNRLNKKYHHYALLEGLGHQNKYKIIPNDIPIGICPLTTKSFSNLDIEQIQNLEKKYDWITVSSFDPRKRHIEFLSSIAKNPLFKNLRGCIIARNPDNKGYINAAHHVHNAIKNSGLENIDVYINIKDSKKIELLSKSKIFVCVSELDWGPRAVIEAMQVGLPILGMPHLGYSTFITPGKNGELVNYIIECKDVLYEMLEKYNNKVYRKGCIETSMSVKPEMVYPNVVKDIKEKSKQFNENLF